MGFQNKILYAILISSMRATYRYQFIFSHIVILTYEPNVSVDHIPEFKSRLLNQLLVILFFTKMTSLYIKVGHDRFLSHRFKFIIN